MSITAPDKYTVTFTFNQNESEEACCELLQGGGDVLNFESPLAVQTWGNLNDWHHALGTGPFILTDFVDGTAATRSRIQITGDMTKDIRRINFLMFLA